MKDKVELDVLDPRKYLNWNDKVLCSDGYSFFHTSNWATVLTDSYGFVPFYFSIIENNSFAFLLPMMVAKNFIISKKVISLPFTDYCQPIMNSKYSFQEILPEIVSIANQQNWKIINLRSLSALNEVYPTSSVYYRHFLPLDDNKEEVFRKFRENYRSKIRKAIRSNVRVTISHSAESVYEYYKLHCKTRQRQGLPPQPYKYFKNVFDHIISKNLGFVISAYVEGRLTAGAIFFYFGERAYYKHGGFDINYASTFSNYLLFWTAIQWLCDNKYKELCFGRSELNHKGLIQFKDGWGTEKHEIYYYKFDVLSNEFIRKNRETEIPGYAILKKVPIPLLRLIGSLIYKYNV